VKTSVDEQGHVHLFILIPTERQTDASNLATVLSYNTIAS
jgi:hypothetical protein